MGGYQGAGRTSLDGVELRWREAVVYLPRSGMRPEGSTPLRTRALLPVPSLLPARLREPARERDVPRHSQGAGDAGEARRERDHDAAIPETPKGMHWSTYVR